MDSYTLAIFTLILLICIHGLFSLKKRKRLPPGPRGLPIVGNLLAIGARPHESLTKLAKIHGPLMTIQLGFNTTVVATSAEMAREILQKNDQAFLGRPIPHAVTAEHNYELSMAWLSGGPKWRSLRKICNSQVFTPQRLDALQGLRNQMMDGMIKSITEASEAKEHINIGRLVFGTTLNLLSNSMFSVDILDTKSNAIQELKQLIGKIMELSGKPNLSDFFPFLKPFDPQGIKLEIKISYDHMHSLLDEIVGQRLKRRKSSLERYGDFLDVLLDQSQEYCGSEDFSHEDVIILLSDLFIGGTDTTTTTLEWAMAELLHNPHIMAKAKQELVEKIGIGKTMEEKDVIRLPYLQSVLKETMRLHMTAPLLLPHRAEIDTEICGYTIPKHTQVFVNAWALARDPQYWDDPTEFLPERFMKSEVDFRGTNFQFLPFSSGRRICPGLALGVRMMSSLLASLFHHFDWQLPNGLEPKAMDMTDRFGTTLQKATPLIAIPLVVE
ncbi:hypothetical protein P3X46_029931 [Hevea brasiliensis]|uniref:Cytochrome P450 n=1 Tax=Hevea brasiliensis TaxID=3981 RepID=A0ABQ9KWX0_HEVBR|nr:geraniol 8-hydroxylase [Hevea brasiliensis]KAJ9147813.1 hypothetical protein P3X46_029931 [Hevea brasiliensis]